MPTPMWDIEIEGECEEECINYIFDVNFKLFLGKSKVEFDREHGHFRMQSEMQMRLSMRESSCAERHEYSIAVVQDGQERLGSTVSGRFAQRRVCVHLRGRDIDRESSGRARQRDRRRVFCRDRFHRMLAKKTNRSRKQRRKHKLFILFALIDSLILNKNLIFFIL